MAVLTVPAFSVARAEGPKVSLLPYQPIARQASPELCAQVTTILTQELGGSDVISLVTGAPADEKGPTEAAAPGNEDAGKAQLDKALKLADSGGKNVKRQKFEPAIKSLEESLRLFAEAAPAVTDVSPVAQANLDLAVAYWKRGREDEAMARMQDAVRLNPEAKLDPKEYFPLFLSVYDAEMRKTLRKERGSVRVEATVPGAEVFFDGKSVGAVPLLLTNAVPGHHFLRVVKDGAGVFGAQIDVLGEKTIEITADIGGGGDAAAASLGPVANAVTSNLVDEEALKAAQGIGKKNGAEYVIFGGVQKRETSIVVASYMVRVKDGKAGRLVDLELDTDLLSASVESFKLVEEVGQRLKDFGEELAPGANPVIRGIEGGGAEKGATEVDVGPPKPEAKKAGTGRSSRVESEGAGDEEGGRVAIGGEEDRTKKGGGSRRRPGSLTDDGPKSTTTDYEPQKSPIERVVSSPILLGGIVVGGVVIAGVVLGIVVLGAAGGTVGGWYVLSPPQSATVDATW